MKVAIFEAGKREADGFAALRGGHEITLVQEPLNSNNAARFSGADAVSVFIYSSIDDSVLAQIPGLRLVTTRSTGYDHIDIAACARRGIAVCNVPDYGANTVAEHVFALLLTISHRLTEAVQRAREGRFTPDGLIGFDLAGRVLGVIGTGSIGRHVIRIGLGFGMEVRACDPRPAPDVAAMSGVTYVDFEELLTSVDVLSLHVPGTPENHHLLSRDAFERMKDGIVIINTARGTLIDSRALIRGLLTGKVAAAGLDVLPDEPLIREEAELISAASPDGHDLSDLVADHVLLRMPNVVVTPHSAYLTREAIERIVAASVENVTAFAAGRPRNLVSPRIPIAT